MDGDLMFAWVHNCPRRIARVAETLRSVEQSDLKDWELWRHGPELTEPDEIEQWWEERLLEAAQRSDYFLRIEDDVLVSASIQSRLKEWPATKEPDFAVGALFRWEQAVAPYWYDRRSPTHARIRLSIGFYGPAQLFKSEHVPAIVAHIRARREAGQTARVGLVNFDWSVFEAAEDLGKSCYLHTPSLAQCTDWNGESTVARAPHLGYFSDDFVED